MIFPKIPKPVPLIILPPNQPAIAPTKMNYKADILNYFVMNKNSNLIPFSKIQ